MSDYTPPTLVIPTPGGNPGDGTLSGELTLYFGGANHNEYLVFGPYGPYNWGFGLSSPRTSSGEDYLVQTDGTNLLLNAPGATGAITLRGSNAGSGGWAGYSFGAIGPTLWAGMTTAGRGVAPILGLDNRTGLTAADASAKTLVTTTSAGQVYRLMGRILATAGTSPSATYTIKWTEGGATITKTLTISALDSDSDLSVLIQPDSGTAITAQLTAISGTGTTVNVAATVEQMA